MQTYVDDKNNDLSNKLLNGSAFLPIGMMFTEEMYKANFILDRWLKRGESATGDQQAAATTGKNADQNKNEQGQDNENKKNDKEDENEDDDEDDNDNDDKNDDDFDNDDNDGGVMMPIPDLSF